MKKAQRMIALVHLLRGRRKWRARDLAEELGVSERTIYRDLADLGEAMRGALYVDFDGEGYVLGGSAGLPPLRLTPEEVRALTVAAQLIPQASPQAQHARQAVAKVRVLAEADQRLFTDEEIAIVTPMVRDRVRWRTLHLLEEAVRDRTRLWIRYFSFQAGREEEHRFDPYGLTFRRHAWYVVGYCQEHRREHLLRASRIRRMRRTGERFERPEGFSLKQFFAESWQVFRGKPVTVKVRFSARVAPLIEELEWHPSQKMRRGSDGRLLFTVKWPVSPEVVAWVLSWGADAEVLAPKALRAEVAEVVRKLAAIYLRSR
jgi:predicted DNA-binding transcriptional regulator YafY